VITNSPSLSLELYASPDKRMRRNGGRFRRTLHDASPLCLPALSFIHPPLPPVNWKVPIQIRPSLPEQQIGIAR
jgi:hypothetical protein